MILYFTGVFIFLLIVVISVYFLSNRSSVSSVPISAEEQKRINAEKLMSDNMPCEVDSNGTYTYQNKICVPTSCNTGYTKYNNACYTDEWYAKEQKRINEADNMPCEVDSNGTYTYQNKICVPTSCNTGYTKYNNACYTDEWYAKEQKRINEADNMPCNVLDSNGTYTYQNKICVPTSCNTGYTKYNNACYKDEWYPHAIMTDSKTNLTAMKMDYETSDRKECMEKCHNLDGCKAYQHDNVVTCVLHKIEPALTANPSEIMEDMGSWGGGDGRGNYGFGFI
jgi:hypothetical protein